MRYIAAYFLVRLSGKQNVTADDIKNVLKAGDIDVDDTQLNKFINDLKSSGKSVDDLIAEGSKRMSALGGGGAPVASSGGAAASAGGAAAVVEATPAEPESESEEEEVEMGGFFDD
jgi:ribosomal protein L12E/L44/L45/RPP1/RPP2